MTYKEALDILFEETPIETIYDFYDMPEYFEFIGSCGGDSLRYRIYKETGKIYEK